MVKLEKPELVKSELECVMNARNTIKNLTPKSKISLEREDNGKIFIRVVIDGCKKIKIPQNICGIRIEIK